MTIHLGYVAANSTLYIPFHTFASTGASVTISGLAVTDIEIYKNGSVTQRSSDAGYTLLDTDGIDFDGLTGIHGFSINLSDNTDSGFYAAGSFYWVVVSAITVDSQTVSFVAATFFIGPAEANVSQFGGTAGTFSGGRPEVNTSHWAGTAVGSATVNANMTQISGDGTAADNLETAFDDTAGAVPWQGILDQGTAQSATGTTLVLRAATAFGADNVPIGMTLMVFGSTQGYWQTRLITDYTTADDTATVDTWDTTPSGTITYKVLATAASSGGAGLDAAGVRAAIGMSSANLDTQLAALPTAAEVVDEWETQSQADPTGFHVNVLEIGGTAQTANDNGADINAILADSNELQTDWADGGRLDLILDARASQTTADAIEADTQNIQSRIPAALNNGAIIADVQRINDVEIVGDGSGTPFDVA